MCVWLGVETHSCCQAAAGGDNMQQQSRCPHLAGQSAACSSCTASHSAPGRVQCRLQPCCYREHNTAHGSSAATSAPGRVERRLQLLVVMRAHGTADELCALHELGSILVSALRCRGGIGGHLERKRL